MAQAVLEIEGTWEEIVSRAAEFAGRKVRLTVLPSETEEDTIARNYNRPIEEVIKELATQVPAEEWAKLPPDLSDNLDHYIYL
jgi:hypothetical protein